MLSNPYNCIYLNWGKVKTSTCLNSHLPRLEQQHFAQKPIICPQNAEQMREQNTEILLSVNPFMKLRRLLNPFKPCYSNAQKNKLSKQDSLVNIICVYTHAMHSHHTKKKIELFKQYTQPSRKQKHLISEVFLWPLFELDLLVASNQNISTWTIISNPSQLRILGSTYRLLPKLKKKTKKFKPNSSTNLNSTLTLKTKTSFLLYFMYSLSIFL